MASLDIVPPDLQSIIPPNFKTQANTLNGKLLMVYGPGSDPSRKYKTELGNALQYIRTNGATPDGLYELKQALFQNNKILSPSSQIPGIAAYQQEIIAKVNAKKAAALAARKSSMAALNNSRPSGINSRPSRPSGINSRRVPGRRGGKPRKTKKSKKSKKSRASKRA